MDFAPYQSSPPEHGRVLSPPLDQSTSPRTSADQQHRQAFSPSQYFNNNYNQRAQAAGSPPPLQHPQPQRQWAGAGGIGIPSPSYYQNAVEGNGGGGGGAGGYFAGVGDGREGVSEFDTSLGVRLDYEACAAYAALPPLGAVVLLILERKSDYVR